MCLVLSVAIGQSKQVINLDILGRETEKPLIEGPALSSMLFLFLLFAAFWTIMHIANDNFLRVGILSFLSFLYWSYTACGNHKVKKKFEVPLVFMMTQEKPQLHNYMKSAC